MKWLVRDYDSITQTIHYNLFPNKETGLTFVNKWKRLRRGRFNHVATQDNASLNRKAEAWHRPGHTPSKPLGYIEIMPIADEKVAYYQKVHQAKQLKIKDFPEIKKVVMNTALNKEDAVERLKENEVVALWKRDYDIETIGIKTGLGDKKVAEILEKKKLT